MPKTYMNQWEWPSNSDPTTKYVISQNWDESFECSCKGWTMHVPRSDCSHIRKLKANPEKLLQGLRFATA